MRSDHAIRACLVIIGLCASLTLSLAACSSMSEGSSTPPGEEMYGGDNQDMDPVHQEKERAK